MSKPKRRRYTAEQKRREVVRVSFPVERMGARGPSQEAITTNLG